MVLLIKNKHASVEDFAHLSDSPAGDTPRRRLTKLSMQSLRNTGVPKAKSMPHINLLVEGGSLKAHCAAMLNADLHKLKPKDLMARKVKSAKEDLRQLFDHASVKQRTEPARGSDPISMELPCSTTASGVCTSGFLDSSSSLAISIPAPSDGQDEEEDHLRCLTVVAQGWLDFERLYPQRRTLFDQPIDEARRDFCQALVQSFSGHSPTASPLQPSQSPGDLVDLPSDHPFSSSLVSSPTPSAITLANQTTITLHSFESAMLEKAAQSPEFSDEELQREFDNFSFHSSQEEEWTSELESRKQNAMNRTLSDMKRKLSIPVPRLSSYLSDDSLVDSAANQTFVNPRVSCSGASSQEADDSSFYLADQEDEAEDDDESVAASLPDLSVCTATFDVDAVINPAGSAELLLASQIDDPTLDEKQDDPDPRATHIAYGTDDVWEALASYVPRLLTRISEESLADEYEIEATAQPPLSFRRPISQYRKVLQSSRQGASPLDHTDQVDFTLAAPLAEDTWSFKAASLSAGTAFTITTDTDDDPSSSPVVNPIKTLRRVRKFIDLKNPIVLPIVQSTSSTETICQTIPLHAETCPPKSQARRLRRIPGCLDLRKAFDGTDTPIGTSPNLSWIQKHSLRGLKKYFGSKEWRSSDLEEGCETQPVSSPCHTLTMEDSPKPPIPPKPPGFRLHPKGVQLSSAITHEPSCLCSRCDSSPLLPLWSCAKITRSQRKRGRPLKESTRALKKRLDSIRIDPETIHCHPL